MRQSANRHTPPAAHFAELFREEHRTVRDGLFNLTEAFAARDVPRTRTLLGAVAAATGPHFRYEEEALYPALVGIFGHEYIGKLLADHDRVIGAAERLVVLSGQDRLSDAAVAEALRRVRGMLPHVSDCEGLSIMVERFADDQVECVLDARQRSLREGRDLITWARDIRERPATPA